MRTQSFLLPSAISLPAAELPEPAPEESSVPALLSTRTLFATAAVTPAATHRHAAAAIPAYLLRYFAAFSFFFFNSIFLSAQVPKKPGSVYLL